ncbi:MAG: GWxTD domain-containing protein, partial [Candidatus Latescibacteria bacterium]|nr:GWxTD domain-containing protein [Candidatus Latescibacterota bacterium]
MGRSRIWLVMVYLNLMLIGNLYAFTASESLDALKTAVKESPKDGNAWVRLGYLYLELDSLKQAEKAFKKGEQYAKSAKAYNGRGVIFMKKGVRYARNALPYFRQALSADPTYIEAQLNIARTQTLLRAPDAEESYRKVITIDSTYAPVYLELAQWYRDKGYEGYHNELRSLYQKYVDLRPDDTDGHYGLALLATEQGEFTRVLEISRAVIKKHGADARHVALIAQAFAGRGDADNAMRLFNKYLEIISAEERMLYEDLRLVALPKELKEYEALDKKEREAFSRKLWRKHDPLIVSDGQFRQAEHYRRVWYARTYFANKIYPWDLRGEVYIRYGEPDYRSRSGHPNPLPPLAVISVKQRMAHHIYDRGYEPEGEVNAFVSLTNPTTKSKEAKEIESLTMTDSGDFLAASQSGGAPDSKPIGFQDTDRMWSWLEVRPDGLEYWHKPTDIDNETFIGPVFSVDRDAFGDTRVPWESWVYVNVGGGIEFVFTDPVMNGDWTFSLPPAGILNTSLQINMQEYNSGRVLLTVASET